MRFRHVRQRTEQPVGGECPHPCRPLCHCRQIPVSARQNLGNSEQFVRPEFPNFSQPGLIDNGDAAPCHEIEMRRLLAGAEQRLSMEQRDEGVAITSFGVGMIKVLAVCAAAGLALGSVGLV